MIVESALCVDAVALAVLVGSLAPLLIPIRKPVAQSEYLLVRMNAELPLLLKEIQATTENLTRSSSMRQCCCMRREQWAIPCSGSKKRYRNEPIVRDQAGQHGGGIQGHDGRH
ncbi:MAG: DUF948 domain-containing protein [Nitrospirota bacterium]